MPIDMTHCSDDDLVNCKNQHQTLNDGIMGKLQGLTLAQKIKLTDLMDKWIVNLKA
jgi:hypothetical protein